MACETCAGSSFFMSSDAVICQSGHSEIRFTLGSFYKHVFLSDSFFEILIVVFATALGSV